MHLLGVGLWVDRSRTATARSTGCKPEGFAFDLGVDARSYREQGDEMNELHGAGCQRRADRFL